MIKTFRMNDELYSVQEFNADGSMSSGPFYSVQVYDETSEFYHWRAVPIGTEHTAALQQFHQLKEVSE
jgi:hypothetical protein